MLVVALSAFLLTPWRIFFDPHRSDSSQSFAWFLFFIAVFALTCLQQGLFVLRNKSHAKKTFTIGSLALPTVLVLTAAGILALGLRNENTLYVIFPVIALRTAFKQIRYWLKPSLHTKAWWFFHLENMFICSIATVTAFIVTALPRIFPNIVPNIMLWMSPTIVMVPWMFWFIARYKKKFS
ncbi:MAG: hypothetical protein EOP10_18675 [Proteobacteria bacterium]|nr:MAG: hypothetical protein EOP10_18675 [Pseudomonadota bacterium]